MRSERGIALPVIVLVTAVVLIAVSFGVYKYTSDNSDEVMPSPSPSIAASFAPSPSTSASASIKPTVKPTLKPTIKPTASPSPTPEPTSQADNNSSGGSCDPRSASISINVDNGSLVGDTLIRISVREDNQGCSANVSKEEILRQGASSTTFSGLTPAKYNLQVSYHGKKYNEEFEVKKGEDASKSVTVSN